MDLYGKIIEKSIFQELLKSDVSYLAQILYWLRMLEYISVTQVGDFRPLFQGHNQMTSPVNPPGQLWSYLISSLLGLGERKCIQIVSVRLPRWQPCPYWAFVSLVHMITSLKGAQKDHHCPLFNRDVVLIWVVLIVKLYHACLKVVGREESA